MQRSQPISRFPYWLPGALLVVMGLLFSTFLYFEQQHRLNSIEQARFEQRASEINLALKKQLTGLTEVVYGLHGLFVVNPELTREQFERAASESDAASRNAGLVNLAFTRRVAAADREAFEARAGAELSALGYMSSGFKIHPAKDRDAYFVIDYIWPHGGNEPVFGLDISSRPTSLQAMQQARDTGELVVSEPFELLQLRGQMGTVLRLPVYDVPRVDAQVPAPQHLVGTVDAIVNLTELMRSLLSDGNAAAMNVRLADLGRVGELRENGQGHVFYQSQTGTPLEQLQVATRDVAVQGRHWQLVFLATDRFLSPPERRLPANSAVAAALLTLLLGAVLTLLMRQRRMALLRAHRSDAARERSEDQFRAFFMQAAVGVARVELETGRLSDVNPRFCSIVGRPEQALRSSLLAELFEPGAEAEQGQQQLQALRALDSGEFSLELPLAGAAAQAALDSGEPSAPQRWVARTVCTMRSGNATPTHAIVVMHDISARRAIEHALRRSESRLRALLQRLPVGVMLMESDGTTALCNQRFTELMGYTEADVPTAGDWWTKAYPDPAYRARLQADWRQAYALARDEGSKLPEAECNITAADGQVHAIEVSGAIVGTQLLVTFVDLSQRKAAEREIRNLAYFDVLTGLPNRRLLVSRIEHGIAHCKAPSRCALLMLDLDNFKALNDTRGHERGDALLKLVAERLLACVRSDDTVARPGGDEFAVLLEGVGDSTEQAIAHCERIAQTILDTLRAPYLIDGEAHHSTLSMGITLVSGSDKGADDVLQRADLAMYQAKAAGRDTLCFYDPSMHAQASERAALEEDMRAGLAAGQFELYYQPQMDHGRIVAAEALLRWRHPQRGFVSPATFIPMAEESGLILPLGQWVLEQACLALAQWTDDPVLAELSLAVNVSPRQFRQAGFIQQLLGTLASTGAAARRLKLELTEGLLLHDVNESAARMTELKSYGVGFSLDDFGTGYSSLSYLKRLPLDQLKIDQSFVRDVLTDPNDTSIVRTIVALGSSLGLQVVAEGVETEAQRDFLERQHCHAWQGYLLSRPVPVDQFVALVRQHAGR